MNCGPGIQGGALSGLPVVSVIIPIFNVESYLDQCLESVLGQTLREIEVICVNDGSTDGSLGIIRKHEEEDPRIVVIDKPNGGYGHSVNCGIERSTGRWIAIVEPDDFIGPRMFEDLVDNAQVDDGAEADIVKSGYWLFYDGENNEGPHLKTGPIIRHMPNHRFVFNVYDHPAIMKRHPSIWSAIYRSEFIQQNSIRMIEPTGAGWADNPWFFDTMLRAKNIVWVPSAHYCYRQTNPFASSDLKDYSIPFDRLKDIRAIYEKLDVKNEGLLLALYHRIFSYVCTTVLGSPRFHESDPELIALIDEAFTFMDPRLALAKGNGIPASQKDYYRDFMGLKLKKVKPHLQIKEPFFSLIVPIKDDRKGLWKTIDSILAQSFEDFEVLFVDCDSKDRGPAIVAALGTVDQRVSLLHEPSGNVGVAFNFGVAESRGSYVAFLRSGVELNDKDALERIAQCIRDVSEPSPDMMITGFDESKVSGAVGIRAGNLIHTEGRRALLSTAVLPTAYGKVFRKGFVSTGEFAFSEEGDEDGHGFNAAALAHVRTLIQVGDLLVKTSGREGLLAQLHAKPSDQVDFEMGRLNAIAQQSGAGADEECLQVMKNCLISEMASALEGIGSKPMTKELYQRLKAAFEDDFAVKSDNYIAFCDYHSYTKLLEVFDRGFEGYCLDQLEQLKKNEVSLKSRLNTMEKKLSALQEKGQSGQRNREITGKVSRAFKKLVSK